MKKIILNRSQLLEVTLNVTGNTMAQMQQNADKVAASGYRDCNMVGHKNNPTTNTLNGVVAEPTDPGDEAKLEPFADNGGDVLLKKQKVEEARLSVMRKKGIVMSKSKLDELLNK